MPYPVLPPDPPPIVHTSSVEVPPVVSPAAPSSSAAGPASGKPLAVVPAVTAERPVAAVPAPALASPEVFPPEPSSATSTEQTPASPVILTETAVPRLLDFQPTAGQAEAAALRATPVVDASASGTGAAGAIAPSTSTTEAAELAIARPVTYGVSPAPIAWHSERPQRPQPAAVTAPRSSLVDTLAIASPTALATAPLQFAQTGPGSTIAPTLPRNSDDNDTRPLLEIPTPPSAPPTPSEVEPTAPEPAAPASPPSSDSPATLEEAIIELTADRQDYDSINRIFRAEGRVVMRYGGAVIDADRLQVNLVDRVAVAEGNVALTRGEQVFRGQAFEYNFVQETGELQGASGEIFLPTTGSDLGAPSPTDPVWSQRPPSDRSQVNEPLRNVTSPGGFLFSLGGAGNTPEGGEVRRVRFEADAIDFYPGGWIAQNIRLTNDPFSPPELELRAEQAEFVQVSPVRDEIRFRRPRLVFDQGLSVPLLRNRIVLDRSPRQQGLFSIGFDDSERGGLYIERDFTVIDEPAFRLTVTPQILVQRGLTDVGFGSAAAYGLVASLEGVINPTLAFTGNFDLSTLEPEEFEDQLRANLRLQQVIGTSWGPHRLTAEYSYRDRLFNGSLGFQDVRQSIGMVLLSPVIPLGDTGISLTYQLGAQSILADTDRLDLLGTRPRDRRVTLGRFQLSAALSRSFRLWVGRPLPATPEAGLRYTPRPLTPYLVVGVNVRGTTSQYTSGDSQDVLTGGVGLYGQFGHFSRPFLDYTNFNISYSESLVGGLSPFFFDRIVDRRVLSFGIRQQLVGPIIIGFQSVRNVDTNREIVTAFSLEYSRRTYGIGIQYDAAREIGFLTVRISDFNWDGTPTAFRGSGVRTVEDGVILP